MKEYATLFSLGSEYHVVLVVVNVIIPFGVAGELLHNAGWFVA